MNYIVVGGVRFYSRKEIKDMLGYMRLLVNPADDESLRRIIAVPPRGHRRRDHGTVRGVRASARNVPLLQVLRETEHDQTLNPRMRDSALAFVHLIDDLAYQAKRMPVRRPGQPDPGRPRATGSSCEQSDEKDFRTRLETVDEFLSACAQFDGQQRGRAWRSFCRTWRCTARRTNWTVREGRGDAAYLSQRKGP